MNVFMIIVNILFLLSVASIVVLQRRIYVLPAEGWLSHLGSYLMRDSKRLLIGIVVIWVMFNIASSQIRATMSYNPNLFDSDALSGFVSKTSLVLLIALNIVCLGVFIYSMRKSQ